MNKIVWVLLITGLLGPLSSTAQTNPTDNQLSIFVDGVCGMCEERIEIAASKVRGVQTADWDVDSRQLLVTFNPNRFEEQVLHQAMAAVGHDTEEATATDEAYNALHGCCKYRDPAILAQHGRVETHEDELADNEIQLFVDGVCGMCEERIEIAASKVRGVQTADWDVDSRQLLVSFNPDRFEEQTLHQAMAAVGHDTEEVTATDEAYNALHGCCKYRNPAILAQHGRGETHDDDHDHEGETEADEDHDHAAHQGQYVHGVIVEKNEKGEEEPIIGATVQWLGGDEGAITDIYGKFELSSPEGDAPLVISYVGYANDTIDIIGQPYVQITLSGAVALDEVEVTYRHRTTEVSFIDPIKIQQIGQGELLKAACCNLSESFETNPAIDASVTDAVTGTRQIEMLGLAGPYVQISRENMPDVRGLSAIYGMTYTPGAWLESIQLLKGPGPVVNGFESIAGQINTELKKPEEGERFHLNLYGNQGGRVEGNINAAHRVTERWSTAILLHGEYQGQENDQNGDGFLDNPLLDDWIAINRWKYRGQNGWSSQLGVKGTIINRQSGQLGSDTDVNSLWGADLKTRRIEGWAKVGRTFPTRPYASMGLQLSALYHDQQGAFGPRQYDGTQNSFYANFIYQGIFGNTTHQWKAGFSYQWDQFNEYLADNRYERNESVPGTYFEYSYLPTDRFTIVAGLRADVHNNYGFFMTPRIFARFAPTDGTVLRISAGQGRRTASIIAENVGALASARQFIIESNDPNLPYGLKQEVAWNFGINWTQALPIGPRELLFGLDLYHTRFSQQIVVDYDHSPQTVRFYNLDGESYSNSFQVQLDYELFPRFDVRLAYRFNDVKTDYASGQLEKPLIGRHRGFINLAYATPDDWRFDFTLNRQGSRRIPSTKSNPEAFQLEERSPAYFLANAQVSKTWNEVFEIYLGGENLFDFTQEQPILAADDPFGEYFDSSLIWAPVFGRMVYAGVRYTIP